MNSVVNFVFTSKTPSRGSGATVSLIFPEIFVSPLSAFEQHMYSSDPRPDTGSLIRLEKNKIEFPVGKKENFVGPQAHGLEARKERSCQSYSVSHITGNEERGACFIAQPLSALY